MTIQTISNDVETVFDKVLAAIDETTARELNEIPFEGSWTIGQVAEHIAICSRGIPDTRVQDAGRPYDEKAAELEKIFLDMDMKAKADPRVAPNEPPHDKTRLTEQLRTNKIHLSKIAVEKDLKQMCLDMEFPFMGNLTRYEWLSFICVHSQRHLNQINNIKKQLG